nr:methyl-accepting chemotaxis protein [Rhodoferax sp.]
QAGSLSQAVSVFKLDGDQAGGPAHHVAAPQRTAVRKPRPAPMPATRAKQAIAAPERRQLANAGTGAGKPAAGGDWETF